jgi:hypothetical protein
VTPATSVNLVRQFLIIHTDLLAGSVGNAYIYIYIYIYIYMHGIWGMANRSLVLKRSFRKLSSLA